MRKRILCALCCTVMLTGLVGCNNSEQQQKHNETSLTQEETKPVNDLSYGISKNTKVPTATSSEEEMKAFYEEVVNNMFSVKNYHVEQETIINTHQIKSDSSLTLPIPKGRGFLLPVARCG